MKWYFSSRPQVIQALQKNRGNLRATYEVLVCAGRQGYTNTSIGFYENVVIGHEFNASAQDSAAYAFAFDLGYCMRPWSWKRDADQSMVKKSSRAKALYFRDRAHNLLPDSPEVLVMRSFWLKDFFQEQTYEGYKATLKATSRAPHWADAYYWQGQVAGYYADSLHTRITNNEVKSKQDAAEKTKQIADLGHLMLRSYNKAEVLDPSLHKALLLERIYAYDHIADKKSAQMIPLLAESHVNAFPSFGTWYFHTIRRTSRQFKEEWNSRARYIAQHSQM